MHVLSIWIHMSNRVKSMQSKLCFYKRSRVSSELLHGAVLLVPQITRQKVKLKLDSSGIKIWKLVEHCECNKAESLLIHTTYARSTLKSMQKKMTITHPTIYTVAKLMPSLYYRHALNFHHLITNSFSFHILL